MFARIAMFPIPPGAAEELTGIFHDTIIPAFREMPGFQAFTLLIDHPNNRVMGITVWDNEATVRQHEASGVFRPLIAKISHLFAGPAQVQFYDQALHVSISETDEPLAGGIH